MKCRSLACVWSGSPPVHRVTAAAALDEPPTLYTGGSDGSIIRWNLVDSEGKTEMKPVAMLCGHAAPIADLGICFPFERSEDKKLTNSNNMQSNPDLINCGAIISACTDGVLCVWDPASGHCRRRRKIPPWAGNPFMMKPLPQNNRYICISCCFANLEHQLFDSIEREEPQSVNNSKCTVLIFDSYTLTLVQTVFHGNLPMGPLKSMDVVLRICPSEDMENQFVMIIDSFGKVIYLPIIKDPDSKGKITPSTPKNSLASEVIEWVDEFDENGLLMGFAKCRNVLALVYRTYCTFRQAQNGNFLGKISFLDDRLYLKDEFYIIGGIFLGDDTLISDSDFVEEFVAWNNKGAACIYKLSFLNNIFKFDVLFSIPIGSNPDTKQPFSFIPLKGYLLHVESNRFIYKEHLFWDPLVTIWNLPHKYDNYDKVSLDNEILGKSNLHDNWAMDSSLYQEGRLVSSSMVISETHAAPFAIIYGFFNGIIEIVQFENYFTESDQDSHSNIQKLRLLGHIGPVLCLASHRTANSIHFLLSGSMDCTIRIWDLDSGDQIRVLHQHVGPVRHIILPPSKCDYPWKDCFLTASDDLCVSLVSLDTLRVERLFPGHLYPPGKVVWDGVRGYIACLCPYISEKYDALDVLYIWDVKTGGRERVLRGPAAHSMYDHFSSGNSTGGNTSVSSLNETSNSVNETGEKSFSPPIRSSSPFPGISTLCFDLSSLMSLCSRHELFTGGKFYSPRVGGGTSTPKISNTTPHRIDESPNSFLEGSSSPTLENNELVRLLEERLLQFSLSFLHLWNFDHELDNLLITEMKLKRPDSFIVASGIMGDRGSMTLAFPGSSSTLELWRSSSEYSALRSLMMVSLAQHLISLSHSYSSASSSLAAFYMRKFAEKIPDIKPPMLQLLVSFWQNEFEHIKMAARSLFHCAASRAIPPPLAHPKPKKSLENSTENSPENPPENHQEQDMEIITSWLDSPPESQDWISCVGGTLQDATTSRIIVAAALSVWYPSLVKSNLAILSVHPLVKLITAVNEKYSSIAAEILAEGMESTWKPCIGSEINKLIGDVFFQVECVQNSSVGINIREALIGVLLPSLAMADIPGFLHVIESQIWSTASDSPVHVVALVTLIRVVRGAPRNLAPYLDKVVTFILQTMDPGNSTMRRSCLQNSMTALKEVVRAFPMIALNNSSTRLAVGDAIGEINTASIRVYDMQSMIKIKVLDASGPPGLPSLLGGASEMSTSTAISALSFSPDGEGLVAFSENVLMIRWWSLGSVWWEKLSRNLVPVQCTKLIFVPPWEGFSPNSTRSSIMSSVFGENGQLNSPGNNKSSCELERLKLLIQNLDLSYRLEWVSERKVKLTQHSHELGTFQL